MKNLLTSRTLAPIALILTCLALSGCSDSSNNRAAGPAPSGKAPSASASRPAEAPLPATLPMPIDPYRLSGADRVELHSAEQALVNVCMQKYDVGYQASGSGTSRPPPEAPYGITDPAWARDYGYRLPPALVGGSSREAPVTPDLTTVSLITGGIAYDPTGKASRNTDQQRLTEYKGKPVPPGGCLGQARRKLAGTDDNRDRTRMASAIYAQGYQQSQQDPRVTAAVAEWSACMKKQGFDYASPLEPANDPDFPKSPPADAEEKKTAIADVSCKESTGLVGIWHRAESEIERGLMADRRSELKAAKDERATRLRNARQVNAQHNG